MGLRLKFNLVLGFTSLIGLLAAGLFTYNSLQRNARAEILESARIMMESAIAVRGYTVSEIRPLLAVQQRRQFMPQSVPAYAASRYVSEFRKNYPEFSYKEATLNPTNPADRATGWESDIVAWFRDHPEEKELVGERMTPTGPALYMGHPIQITNENCLVCHSTPAEAPQTLIDTYGDDNGFGWKMNEIIGAQIVQVPMSLPLERARSALITFMGSLVMAFLLVALLLNVLLHNFVIKPVQALSAQADAMSMGGQNVEELEVVGNDEMTALARSFNRMHRSLATAMKMLDDETVLRRE